jgi:uncharacterized protein YcbK (DUF882 family)
LSSNFASQEFNCPCSECKITLVDEELVAKLQKMHDDIGSKLKITSGYRCASHQKHLTMLGYETAKGVSQHQLGKAADVTNGVTPGGELEGYARDAGFKAVGVAQLWIHVDTRDDMDRRWFYTKKR